MAAKRAAGRCDVMIVAGSSLEVSPASDLPVIAVARQARLIIVNRDPIYMDQHAEVVIHDDLACVLPQIAAACLSADQGESLGDNR
jgi:NAD-dependent deacetylase